MAGWADDPDLGTEEEWSCIISYVSWTSGCAWPAPTVDPSFFLVVQAAFWAFLLSAFAPLAPGIMVLDKAAMEHVAWSFLLASWANIGL